MEAKVAKELGQFDVAHAALEQVLARPEDSAWSSIARLSLLDVVLREGNFDAVEEIAEHLLRANAWTRSAHLAMCIMHAHRGDLSAFYESATSFRESPIEVLTRVGWAGAVRSAAAEIVDGLRLAVDEVHHVLGLRKLEAHE